MRSKLILKDKAMEINRIFKSDKTLIEQVKVGKAVDNDRYKANQKNKRAGFACNSPVLLAPEATNVSPNIPKLCQTKGLEVKLLSMAISIASWKRRNRLKNLIPDARLAATQGEQRTEQFIWSGLCL